MEELNLTFVEELVKRVGTGKGEVLEILQAIQGHYGYLPKEALRRVCDLTDITPASITGVSTFYDQFRHRPAGQHTIRVFPMMTIPTPTSCSPWRRWLVSVAACWRRRFRSMTLSTDI